MAVTSLKNSSILQTGRSSSIENTRPVINYEVLNFTTTGSNLTVTNNNTDSVNIFKTSGTTAWDNQAYLTQPFVAPVTVEFNKNAGATDNANSYAMISWNADPTTDASYTSLDYAAYPYQTNAYQLYHNGSSISTTTPWDASIKLYIVYSVDGYIYHYNGSTLLYSVNKGTGATVYLDSSFYSANNLYGGFSNIRVKKAEWNGSAYI